MMMRNEGRVYPALNFVLAVMLATVVAIPGKAISGTNTLDTNWTHYGGNAYHQKYTPLVQLTPENIQQLEIAWIWESPDAAIDRNLQESSSGSPVTSSAFKTTPLVINHKMYVRTSYGLIVALDPATGDQIWVFDPASYKHPVPANFGHSARGLAFWSHADQSRVITITSEGTLIALDPQTGLLLDDFGIHGKVDVSGFVEMPDLSPAPAGQYAFYPPPLICGNTIIAGFTVPRSRPVRRAGVKSLSPNWTRGDIHGFDVRTGAHLWTFHTLPRPGENGVESWQQDSWEFAGKANMWSSMSCDEALGLAYLPIAAASENFIGIHRPGNNLFSQSVVALNARTGQSKWHYQTIHHGLWDYDLPTAPVLMDLTISGREVKALAQLSKNGFVYVLDRINGQPVWPINERPVRPSPIPSEYAAPTQPYPTLPRPVDVQGPLSEDSLIDLTPDLRRNAKSVLDTLGDTSLFTPIGTTPTLLLPGVGGGPNWGGAAFDPDLNYLFIPSQTRPHVFQFQTFEPDDDQYATSTMGLRLKVRNDLLNGLPITKPPYSRLTAIDMTTGKHAWVSANGWGYNQHPALKSLQLTQALGSSGISGVLATKSIVFSADAGSYKNQVSGQSQIRAFNKQNGTVLWEAVLPGKYSGAAPISYIANGRQFVVIAVGGDAHPNRSAPSLLVAFSLPEAGTSGLGLTGSAPVQQKPKRTSLFQTSGEGLYLNNGCPVCHASDRQPLVLLERYSNKELAAIIREPASELMPAYDLADKEINILIKYLRTRKQTMNTGSN